MPQLTFIAQSDIYWPPFWRTGCVVFWQKQTREQKNEKDVCVVFYFAEDTSPTHNSESNYPTSISSKAAAFQSMSDLETPKIRIYGSKLVLSFLFCLVQVIWANDIKKEHRGMYYETFFDKSVQSPINGHDTVQLTDFWVTPFPHHFWSLFGQPHSPNHFLADPPSPFILWKSYRQYCWSLVSRPPFPHHFWYFLAYIPPSPQSDIIYGQPSSTSESQ